MHDFSFGTNVLARLDRSKPSVSSYFLKSLIVQIES